MGCYPSRTAPSDASLSPIGRLNSRGPTANAFYYLPCFPRSIRMAKISGKSGSASPTRSRLKVLRTEAHASWILATSSPLELLIEKVVTDQVAFRFKPSAAVREGGGRGEPLGDDGDVSPPSHVLC